MGLIISSLLGTSAFLKQLCAPVGIWDFHAHFLSDLGSDSVPSVSKSTSCSEFGAVSPLWHWVAPGERVGPGPSCSWGSVVCEQGGAWGSAWEVLHRTFWSRGAPRVSSRAPGRDHQGANPIQSSPTICQSYSPGCRAESQSPCEAVGNAADEVCSRKCSRWSLSLTSISEIWSTAGGALEPFSTEAWLLGGLNAEPSCWGHPREGRAVFATQGSRLSCALQNPGLLAHLSPLLPGLRAVLLYILPFGLPMGVVPNVLSSVPSAFLQLRGPQMSMCSLAPQSWCLWCGSAATARVSRCVKHTRLQLPCEFLYGPQVDKIYQLQPPLFVEICKGNLWLQWLHRWLTGSYTGS